MSASDAETTRLNSAGISLTILEEIDGPTQKQTLPERIRKTRRETNGNMAFGKEMAAMMCSSLACSLISVLLLALPIAEIVIGILYLADCPVQRLIPIALIVAGSFGAFRALWLSILSFVNSRRSKDSIPDYGLIIDIFNFCWLIAASVWVYSIFHSVDYYNRASAHYCHEVLYKFSFGVITATWSIVGMVMVVTLCFCCCGLCFACAAVN